MTSGKTVELIKEYKIDSSVTKEVAYTVERGEIILPVGVQAIVLSSKEGVLHLQLISEVWADVRFGKKATGKIRLYEATGISVEYVKEVEQDKKEVAA